MGACGSLDEAKGACASLEEPKTSACSSLVPVDGGVVYRREDNSYEYSKCVRVYLFYLLRSCL